MTPAEYAPRLRADRRRFRPRFLYLVRADESGRYKVGSTRRLRSRLRELSTQEGEPVRLVCYVPSLSGHKAEREVHARLDRYRIGDHWRCEWYALPPELEGEVCRFLHEHARHMEYAARLFSEPVPLSSASHAA